MCGTKVGLKAERGDPLLGKTLGGKYRVLQKLGAGSMGTVYLGEHIGLKKKVALKILHPELQVTDEALQRFQREGIAAGQFNHQNAIQIFDFDREGRICYLAMEYVEGRTLREVIQDGRALDVRAAIDFALQLLRVLAEAHRHGIVHRDLKPDNMMIMESATGERVLKVLDFGLSKLLGRPLGASMQTQVGRIVGTPLYMAPEQGEAERSITAPTCTRWG
ncbi:MAG: serine/threonine-protein kinase [Planctomycetota bacterium]